MAQNGRTGFSLVNLLETHSSGRTVSIQSPAACTVVFVNKELGLSRFGREEASCDCFFHSLEYQCSLQPQIMPSFWTMSFSLGNIWREKASWSREIFTWVPLKCTSVPPASRIQGEEWVIIYWEKRNVLFSRQNEWITYLYYQGHSFPINIGA